MSGRGSSVAAAREGPRRAGRPPSQDRSPTALRPPTWSGWAQKVWGNYLRIPYLRFRPAHTSLAAH